MFFLNLYKNYIGRFFFRNYFGILDFVEVLYFIGEDMDSKLRLNLVFSRVLVVYYLFLVIW